MKYVHWLQGGGKIVINIDDVDNECSTKHLSPDGNPWSECLYLFDSGNLFNSGNFVLRFCPDCGQRINSEERTGCDIDHKAFAADHDRWYREGNSLVGFAAIYCPECGVKL